jgi:hypothetical protein
MVNTYMILVGKLEGKRAQEYEALWLLNFSL